jgi:hypothetical protein
LAILNAALSCSDEQGISLRDAWDEVNLKVTCRTMDNEIMNQWYELKQIAGSVIFVEEDDSIIWKYNSTGKYSVQSLSVVVNDRGIKQIFTHVIWKFFLPPKLHILLWLLANNKVHTRENLAKRRKLKNMSCLFCNEQETTRHLFFVVVLHKCSGRTLLKYVINS